MRIPLTALVVSATLLSGCAGHSVTYHSEQPANTALLIDEEIKRLLVGEAAGATTTHDLIQREALPLSSGETLLSWLRQQGVPTSLYYDLPRQDKVFLSRLAAGTLLARVESAGEAVGFAVQREGGWWAVHQAQFPVALAPAPQALNTAPAMLDRYDLPIVEGSLSATLAASSLSTELQATLEPVLARGFPEARFPKQGLIRLRLVRDADSTSEADAELASAALSSHRASTTHYIVRVTSGVGKAPVYFDGQGRPLEAGWIGEPVDGEYRLTSEFDPHRRHPVTGRVRPHNGMDLAAAQGTPVIAASDGEVVHSGRRGSWGNLVVLRHDHGIETRYAHLASINGLAVGDHVSKGDRIGGVGTTGLSTGPHLHFEVYQHGLAVNPAEFDPMGNVSVASRSIREHLTQYRNFEQASLSGLIEAPAYLASTTDTLVGQGGPDDEVLIYSTVPVMRTD